MDNLKCFDELLDKMQYSNMEIPLMPINELLEELEVMQYNA